MRNTIAVLICFPFLTLCSCVKRPYVIKHHSLHSYFTEDDQGVITEHKKHIVKEGCLIFPDKSFTHIEAYSLNSLDDETSVKYAKERRELMLKENLTEVEKQRWAKLNIQLNEMEAILNDSGELYEGAKLIKKLTMKETNELGRILQVHDYDSEEPESDCFIPRHAVVFKKNKKIVGFIEVCFECRVIKFSPKMDLRISEKDLTDLRVLFKKMGY